MLYRVLCRKYWEDGEPERLTISVERDQTDGVAHVVFVTSAAWMSLDQTEEIIAWLTHCHTLTRVHNELGGVQVHKDDTPCPQNHGEKTCELIGTGIHELLAPGHETAREGVYRDLLNSLITGEEVN